MSGKRAKLVWPKSVTVLGQGYDVAVVDHIDDEGTRGDCNVQRHAIRVKQDSDDWNWSTLLHELAHAWLEESKLNTHLSDELEELLVVCIEQQFLPLVFELLGKRSILPK